MGIFRRFSRKLQDVSAPVCVQREEVKKIASKRGDGVVSLVELVNQPIDKYVVDMPSAKEYDLEEMLKSGYNPQQVEVHGILGSTDNYDFEGNLSKLVNEVDNNENKSVISNINKSE